jgi:hypothetical protein
MTPFIQQSQEDKNMTRTAFPSPGNIRRQTPQEIYGADARYLLNNLSKEFERQGQQGQANQSIAIRRRGTYGNNEAVWIRTHELYPDQRAYTIETCNNELAESGWRITGFDFKKVNQYQWWGGGSPMPTMTTIIVNMEYICDAACAAK